MRKPEDQTQEPGRPDASDGAEHRPYDERRFFASFYASSVRDEPTDRDTIGAITDAESRFHYNATENSMLRAYLRWFPPARGPMISAARALMLRRRRRVLDIGSGSGHWIDFSREVLLYREAVGIEIADQMVDWLQRRYTDDAGVRILKANIADEDFDPESLGEPFDLVTAIGVMFHIVEDERWERAIANVAGQMKPGALWFVGGDFGPETRDVQFHATDDFGSWKEFDQAELDDSAVLVNKRVRSLAHWGRVVSASGLEIVDLVRSDRDPSVGTPENDVLVLRRPEP